MRSPIAALTWEIWQRGRRSAWLVLGCISLGALVNLVAPESFGAPEAGPVSVNLLYGLLMVVSFLLLFGIFNYTEYNSTKEWNGFPYRLFALPIRTWQLVALPMLLGVASVELLYVAWIKLVLTHQTIPRPEWFAVLFAAYMIFYQAALWGLAGYRITRIIVLGAGGTSGIGVAFLPMFAQFTPSPWFSEERLIAIVVGLALTAFVIAWVSLVSQRCGGGRRQSWIKRVVDRVSDAMPRRSKGFNSRATAQFWFEWRRSGWLLPGCTAFALVVLIGPFAWFTRAEPDYTMYILVRVLAVPLVLAFAIGKGFIKPEFWSTKLSLSPFVAVRPISDEEFIVTKMKVAALSIAIAWLLVLAFLVIWLPFLADTTPLEPLLFAFRMFYPHTWHVITVLSFAGFVILSWRYMVNGLWTGLSGSPLYYIGSMCVQVIIPLLLLILAGIFSDRIDSAIRANQDQMISISMCLIGWLLALAVIARIWFAAFFWSKSTPRLSRRYVIIWSSATLGFVVLAILIGPPFDVYRQEHLYVLGAFLLVPFARTGAAPLALARNRHR